MLRSIEVVVVVQAQRKTMKVMEAKTNKRTMTRM